MRHKKGSKTKMRAPIFLIAALLTTLPATNTAQIPVSTKGWVSTLREEKLALESHTEIVCKDKPLDEIIILLAKTLDQPNNPANFIFPNNTTFPKITGKFSGHALTTIENLLHLHQFHITEKQRVFIIRKNDNPDRIYTKTHYINGLRLNDYEDQRPSLPEVLEKVRTLLQIPNAAGNRITESGRTTGWRQNDDITARRIQYNTAENSFFLNGTHQEHLWISTLINNLNMTEAVTISILETQQTIHAHGRQIIQLGAETPATLTHAQNTWKLESSGSALVPIATTVETQTLTGNILTFWIHQNQPNLYTVHSTFRHDTITNNTPQGNLHREIKTETIQTRPNQPFATPAGLHLIITPETPKPTQKTHDYEQLRKLIEKFPQQTILNTN
jgi:hypothetical protein